MTAAWASSASALQWAEQAYVELARPVHGKQARHRLQWTHYLRHRAADHGSTEALYSRAVMRKEAGDREGAEALLPPVPPKPGRPASKPWQTTPQAQCALGVRMAGIGLVAAIEELRQELYRAQDLGADQQFAFGIEEAELELQLELRNSGKGDGKVSFGVATVGAGGEHSTVRTHRLTLKLSVRDRARGGSSPEISDTETGSWDEE